MTETTFYHEADKLRSFCDVLIWFATAQRVGFYLAVRVCYAIVVPWVYLAAVILVKRCLVGRRCVKKVDA